MIWQEVHLRNSDRERTDDETAKQQALRCSWGRAERKPRCYSQPDERKSKIGSPPLDGIVHTVKRAMHAGIDVCIEPNGGQIEGV